MTPKEQLRKKFFDILPYTPEFSATLDALMAAVEEVLSLPLYITIQPSDEQLESLRKAFHDPHSAVWSYIAYGDPNRPKGTRWIDNTVFDERTYGDEEC